MCHLTISLIDLEDLSKEIQLLIEDPAEKERFKKLSDKCLTICKDLDEFICGWLFDTNTSVDDPEYTKKRDRRINIHNEFSKFLHDKNDLLRTAKDAKGFL